MAEEHAQAPSGRMLFGDVTTEPTPAAIKKHLQKHFGDDFVPTGEQTEWATQNWGKAVEVSNIGAVLPPIRAKVEDSEAVLTYGHHGTPTVVKPPLDEPLPLDQQEPEWSKQAAKELRELAVFEKELGEKFDKDISTAGDLPPVTYLIEGILAKDTLNLISGKPGLGKTRFILQMAACLMTGEPFLGYKTRRCRVLLVERNEPQALIGDKVKKLASKFPWLPELEIFWGSVKLDAQPKILEELAWYMRTDVLFIDTYSDLHDKNENQATDMSPILDCLRGLTERGVTVVCLHHLTKPSEFDPKGHARGSSAIEGECDFSFTMSEKEGRIVIEPTKKRLGIQKITLKSNEDTLDFTRIADSTKERVKELLASGLSDEKILAELPEEKPETVKKYLRELRKKTDRQTD